MPNDSTVAGYLAPTSTPPLEDAAFEDFLHDVFVGLTGLDAKLIRPRWQGEPPDQPDFAQGWMAFGVMRQAPDTYAAIVHSLIGDGTDELQRHETDEILLSAYGASGIATLKSIDDGFQIEQNREVLRQNAMGLEATGEILTVPSLVKDRWLRRFDMTMIMRRQIRRTYQVVSLLSAQGGLQAQASGSLIVSPLQAP